MTDEQRANMRVRLQHGDQVASEIIDLRSALVTLNDRMEKKDPCYGQAVKSIVFDALMHRTPEWVRDEIKLALQIKLMEYRDL